MGTVSIAGRFVRAVIMNRMVFEKNHSGSWWFMLFHEGCKDIYLRAIIKFKCT